MRSVVTFIDDGYLTSNYHVVLNSFLPNHAPADYGNLPARQGRDAARIQFMLRRVNPLMQSFRRVIVQHRHDRLTNNGAGVHACVHEMHRATRHLHAVIQRLLPRLQPGKTRQQRRMDVDDAALERAQKIALQHAHETGEHDQIHPRILQRGDEGAFRRLVQFGAELARRNELRRNFPFAGVRQDSRRLDVAQNHGDLRRNFSRRHRVGDGDKVRAFAGAEHADAKWIVHRDLNSRASGRKKGETRVSRRRDQLRFRRREDSPLSRRQIAEPEISDAHAHQPQRRMADGRRHPPHLAVLALDEFQSDPAIRHALAKADGRIARRHLGLRFQQPCAARQGLVALNHQTVLHFVQHLARRDLLHLRPILALVGVARVQEFFIPVRLVAQEQQALGIRVESADGVNVFRKTEFRQRTVRRAVVGELRQHAVRFVERDEHRKRMKDEL